MVKDMVFYLWLAFVAAAVYSPGATDTLLADDWPLVSRNMNMTSSEALQRFQTVNAGWYRPLFDIFIAFCWQLFGLRATGYHLLIMSLYILIAALVGYLAKALTGERVVGILSAVFFAVHSVHAEPVLWIASANEILAGLFILLSFSSYLIFRKSTNQSLTWLSLTYIFYLLSISSKETAVSLPLILVAYDFLFYRAFADRFRWSLLAPIAPLLLIAAGFTIFRLSMGSPYPISVLPTRIGINLIYYLAVQIFMLPDNYGYFTSLPLWKQAPFLPIFSVSLATFSLLLLGWLGWKSVHRQLFLGYSQVMIFALSWCFLALSPVILTATGRTAFISSIGISWLLATSFFLVWESTRASKKKNVLVITSLTLFVSTSLIVAAYRTYWWGQAADTTQRVLAQLNDELSAVSGRPDICLVGLPDHLRHAYTFRNAFPAINQLLYPTWRIQVILDNELNQYQLASQITCAKAVRYQYNHKTLVPVH